MLSLLLNDCGIEWSENDSREMGKPFSLSSTERDSQVYKTHSNTLPNLTRLI